MATESAVRCAPFRAYPMTVWYSESQKQTAHEKQKLLYMQEIIWQGRKHWLRVLREVRNAQNFERQRPAFKGKKLHRIDSMLDAAGNVTYAHEH